MSRNLKPVKRGNYVYQCAKVTTLSISFLPVLPQINIRKQYDNNFTWSIITLFTGKYTGR